ncbi:LLM class flavin-dependent oxidoreductase [Streptomyces griseomycini]|uniref:LLM class flavin-dependent oxidoreductase n=1 Tax=Streptomyces griseomycini TaxID=66895 RepID=UPI0035716F46
MRQERVDFTGRFFSARQVAIGGGRPRRPPLAVAATGKHGMRTAARFADLWITQNVGQDPTACAGAPHAEVRRPVALLDEVCARQGREPGTLPRLAVLGYGGEPPCPRSRRSATAWAGTRDWASRHWPSCGPAGTRNTPASLCWNKRRPSA